LRLNFDDDEADEVAPPTLKLPVQRKSAEQWFDEGHAHEVSDRLADAAESYRKALAEQSPFPEAHFNLGNVLVQLGHREAAIEHYQMAVSQEPAFELAWYNLGFMQDESGRTAQAVQSLTKAVEIDPSYADAHFNLASCLERLGRVEDAVREWKAYLRLDPVGQTAAQVRSRVERLSG
jgi:tetratricopeptide (TPR) repeat protein